MGTKRLKSLLCIQKITTHAGLLPSLPLCSVALINILRLKKKKKEKVLYVVCVSKYVDPISLTNKASLDFTWFRNLHLAWAKGGRQSETNTRFFIRLSWKWYFSALFSSQYEILCNTLFLSRLSWFSHLVWFPLLCNNFIYWERLPKITLFFKKKNPHFSIISILLFSFNFCSLSYFSK